MSVDGALSSVEKKAIKEYEHWSNVQSRDAVLKIAVFALIVLEIATVAALAFVSVRLSKQQPYIVRIGSHGEADLVRMGTQEYKPQAEEVRYFLSLFTRDFYERRRAVVRDHYLQAMWFLAAGPREIVFKEDRESNWLPKFEASADEEIDVTVNNVIPDQLTTSPYQARVEYTKQYIPNGGVPGRKERWTMIVKFELNPRVPDRVRANNPLGLLITYFQTYKEQD